MDINLEAPPHSPISTALADPYVRGFVTETLRRRVPGDDAPDVAQAVFCDALDSRTVPPNAREIPFWLVGVARHAAADYFRRRPRERGEESLEPSCDPPRFEVREAVARVLESLGDGARKTLMWMMLEQEGVELRTIAREEKLSATAVRARVYRLRRVLRRELSYLLCCVAFVSAGAHVAHRLTAAPVTVAAATGLPSSVLGHYAVVQVDLDADVDGVVRAALSRVTTVSVGPSEVAVGPFTLRVESVSSARGSDDVAVTLVDPHGRAETVSVRRVSADRVLVTAPSGRVRGRILLTPSR